MSNLEVSRVSFGDNLINQQATKPITTEPKSDNNKISDNAKIMIGLGALSTAVLGGLLAHKCIKFNKLSAKLEETLTKNNTLQEQLSNAETKLTDSEKIIKELNEKIEKLPQNIKLHETKKGRLILSHVQEIYANKNTPEIVKRDIDDYMKFYNYKFVEYKPEDFAEFANCEHMGDCFNFRNSLLKEGKTSVPALIYKENNGDFLIIHEGKYYLPKE